MTTRRKTWRSAAPSSTRCGAPATRPAEPAPYVFSFATSITWKAKRQKELQSERVRRYPVERGEGTLPTSRDGNFADNPETLMFGERRTTPPLISPRISNLEYDRLEISVTLRERAIRAGSIWTADLALPLLKKTASASSARSSGRSSARSAATPTTSPSR